MNERIVKVGLIGYGFGGRIFHAPILTSVLGLKLEKIYETKPDNIADIKKKYPEANVINQVEDIFNDKEIELVVVATPNQFHFEYAKKAMESGKHVIVEKPFTITSKEADELIKISQTTGKLLTVNHNRRWDSDFKTVVSVIKSNLLGEVIEFESHYDRFSSEAGDNWRVQKSSPGSGMLYDLGSHLIDQALFLFGLPQEVFGYVDKQRTHTEVDDCFEVILRYPGLKVTLKSGMLIQEKGPHYCVHGRNGSFVKYGLDIQEDELIKGKIPNECSDWGREPEELYGKLNTLVNGVHMIGNVESETGDYRSLYQNLYDAILGKEELAVKAQQARNTIRVIELASQSNEEKRWVPFE